ncbi:phosphatase, partial [Streptomyces sp. NPDC056730]
MTLLADVERAVRSAAPHALLDALRGALATSYGATSVQLYLADYGLTVLQRVDAVTGHAAPGSPSPTLSPDNSPEGRAF